MANTDWMIVESPDNWKIDRANGFTYFGVTARYEYLKDRVKAGDRLFAYVTGKGGFSDIRQVTKDGLRKLRLGGDYDMALPFCLDTEPLVVLPKDQWLPIADIKDRLVMTAGKQHWGQVLRTAFKKLDPADGDFLYKAIEAQRVRTS